MATLDTEQAKDREEWRKRANVNGCFNKLMQS